MENTKKISLILALALFLTCFSALSPNLKYYSNSDVADESYHSVSKTEFFSGKGQVLLIALAPIVGYGLNNYTFDRNSVTLKNSVSIENILLNLLWLALFMYMVFIVQNRRIIMWQKCCDGKK